MNTDDVLRLLDAGFTKDEIMSMYIGNPAPAADGVHPEEPETAPQPEEAQPTPEPEPAADDERIARIESAINSLAAQIQKSNLNNRGIDTLPEMTAEQALGSLITKKG